LVVVFADAGGIPCGTDYHQPSDTSDKLDPQLMEQITQLVSATAAMAARRGGWVAAWHGGWGKDEHDLFKGCSV
jgi:hypothetical protein